MTQTAAPVSVRQSYLDRFRHCHLSAKLGDEAPDASSHPQGRGTIAHGFTARFATECTQRGVATLDPGLAKRLMKDEITRSGLALPPEEYDTLMALAWKFATERRIDTDSIVDVEQPYRVTIAGAVVTGRPDVLWIRGVEAEIRDYKTGWMIDPHRLRPQYDADAELTWLADPAANLDGTFQLRTYAVLVSDAYPQLERFRLTGDYLRWGTQREVTLTAEDVEAHREYLAVLVRQIHTAREQDEWLPTPGSWCAICPAAHKCPLPSQYRGPGEIANRETAEAVAEWLITVGQLVTERKAALKAWVDQDEPVVVGDKVFEFRLGKDGWKVRDYETLLNAMEATDLPVEQYLQQVKGSTRFRDYKRESENGAA